MITGRNEYYHKIEIIYQIASIVNGGSGNRYHGGPDAGSEALRGVMNYAWQL
jgi:hypothetical protein